MIATENASGQCGTNMAADAFCRTTEMVKENPGLSMLIVFGVGIGVGAILGEAIPFAYMTQRTETTAERIGRQICEAFHIKM